VPRCTSSPSGSAGAIREAVTGAGFEDMLAELPREYTALLDESD
jgi:hypothetical protein